MNSPLEFTVETQVSCTVYSPLPFVLLQKYAAMHHLLISGEKIKAWVLLPKIKKPHSLMCLDCSFMTVSITAWLSLQRQLQVSHVLSSSCCIFAAFKHCDVQSTAGGPSVTETMLPPYSSSFHLGSSYASSWAADIYIFIRGNNARNSEFCLAHSGTQLIIRKISAPLCHTEDLLALEEEKCFRRSAVMLCLTVLCMH